MSAASENISSASNRIIFHHFHITSYQRGKSVFVVENDYSVILYFV